MGSVPDDAGLPPFAFPAHLPRDEAARLLADTYRGLDDGKLLRAALKRQRNDGWDPPGDVQYVVEPILVDHEGGVGIGLRSDILLHEEFPGVDRCLAVFEDVVGDALVKRLEKRVRKWLKRHPWPDA